MRDRPAEATRPKQEKGAPLSVSEVVPITVLPEPETSGRSVVYRIFGDKQRLLYIGSSERPRQRWHEHRNRTVWWSEARTYSLTWLPTREAAYEAEASAIAVERPVFNHVWQPRPTPQPRVSDEEVRRVSEALDAVEQIADLEERVRAKSQVMSEQVKRNKTWQQERRDLVFELRAQGVSFRKIAERVGTSLATVQDILRGYSGSGSHRPRATDEADG